MEERAAEIIGGNMKRFREARNMTKKEFSVCLSMDYYNYVKMEQGKYTPSLKKCLEICGILDIHLDELFREVDYQDELEKFVELRSKDLEKPETGEFKRLTRMMVNGAILYCEWCRLISMKEGDAIREKYGM